MGHVSEFRMFPCKKPFDHRYMNIREVIKIALSSETVSPVGLYSIFYRNVFFKLSAMTNEINMLCREKKSLIYT